MVRERITECADMPSLKEYKELYPVPLMITFNVVMHLGTHVNHEYSDIHFYTAVRMITSYLFEPFDRYDEFSRFLNALYAGEKQKATQY